MQRRRPINNVATALQSSQILLKKSSQSSRSIYCLRLDVLTFRSSFLISTHLPPSRYKLTCQGKISLSPHPNSALVAVPSATSLPIPPGPSLSASSTEIYLSSLGTPVTSLHIFMYSMYEAISLTPSKSCFGGVLTRSETKRPVSPGITKG